MLTLTRQRGFTLIELMVALVIGLLLMLGLTTFLINNIRSNSDTLKAIRLNQEMRATMMLMSRELRRAGYWASTASATNPFQTMTTSTAGCVLYSYDRNATASTTVPSDVQYGFLLASGAVYMRSGGSSYTCTPGANNVWEAVTDDHVTKISSLSFVPSSASGTVAITLVGELKNASEVKQTLVETVKLENGPLTFN